MSDVTKSLTDALAKLQETRKRVAPLEEPVIHAMPAMLDIWPENVRGVPNPFLRGALFSVSQQREVALKRELLASVEGVEIWFKGERFNQTDLDVWQTLLHLSRLSPLGNEVEFVAQTLLLALGRGTSGKHHEELKEDLVRLIGGVVEITWAKGRKVFVGALVSSLIRNETTQHYVLTLNPQLKALFESGYTQVYWPHRRALKSNHLSKWLHGFYASHAQPYPYKVITLRSLCGSKQADLFGFRRQLRKALQQLLDIQAIAAWEIGADDLVKVTTIPSLSQQLYVAEEQRLRRHQRRLRPA